MNRIILMGRMVKDPELRRTNEGTPVSSFTLAVDRFGKEKKTDFIDLVAWKGTAEFVAKYFTKGQMCLAEGRLQIRDWTDKEGNKRRTAEVVADGVYFAGNRNENRGGEPRTSAELAELDDESDDDLPF